MPGKCLNSGFGGKGIPFRREYRRKFTEYVMKFEEVMRLLLLFLKVCAGLLLKKPMILSIKILVTVSLGKECMIIELHAIVN